MEWVLVGVALGMGLAIGGRVCWRLAWTRGQEGMLVRRRLLGR